MDDLTADRGGGWIKAAVILVATVVGLLPASATQAEAARIVTTKGLHRIVVLNPKSENIRTLKVLKRFQKITSVSTAFDSDLIAYSVENRKRLAESTVIRDQIWLMRRDGSRARLVKEWIRKQRGRDIIFPPPDNRGSQTGVERVELSSDGKKILVTKPFPFVAFEYVLRTKSWKFANPGDCGMSHPTYDPSATRILAFYNCGGDRFGLGIMSVRKKKVNYLTKRGIDFLGTAPTMSPDGKTIAYPASRKPDDDPTDGYVRGSLGIWLMDRETGKVRILEGTRNSKYNFEYPRYSPDGKQIATSTTNRVIPDRSSRIHILRSNGSDLHTVFRGITTFQDRIPQWLP